MHIINCIQGSQAWLDLRQSHDTASEAPAALGQSKYTSRTDLMKQKSTGLTEDVVFAKQKMFDRGHESEAQARPLAEAIIGSDLYPVTATLDFDGMKLLASLDGTTMDEEILFEHKLWSEPLAADVRNDTLAPHYTIQMDQQLLVSGASKCLFMVSDGTEEKMVWCWYESSPEKFDALIAGWKQFHADLAAYVPVEVVAKAVGHTPESLPALRIEVTGMVTASNLDAYKTHALAVFSGINRELTTDQQFADAEKVVKWCGDVEDRLAAAKQHALSQTESIDALFRTIDEIGSEAKRTRLELDKLVKARKEQVRVEIVNEGVAALKEHIASLNGRLGKPYMPLVSADFAGSIKGKRTVDSIRDAVHTTLANAKIEASATADKIQVNLNTLRELAKDHSFLFSDTGTIVFKAPDDLTMLVKSRIADHKAAEAAKEEATRERIRAEEQAKAEKEAREKLAAEQAEIDRIERKRRSDADALSAQHPQTDAPALVAQPSPTAPAVTFNDVVKIMMPPAVRQAMAPATSKPATPPDLKLGQMAERLGFVLTAAFLSELGFEPAATDRASKLYHEADFPRICAALVNHINAICETA